MRIRQVALFSFLATVGACSDGPGDPALGKLALPFQVGGNFFCDTAGPGRCFDRVIQFKASRALLHNGGIGGELGQSAQPVGSQQHIQRWDLRNVLGNRYEIHQADSVVCIFEQAPIGLVVDGEKLINDACPGNNDDRAAFILTAEPSGTFKLQHASGKCLTTDEPTFTDFSPIRLRACNSDAATNARQELILAAPDGVIPGTWTENGPGPIVTDATGPHPRDFAGALETVVADPTSADTLYAAAVNGGVWRTFNATEDRPKWTALTDQLPSLSISALAMDKANNQRLVAGTGGRSSFFGTSGIQGLVYVTSDGGANWSVKTSLTGQNISSIVVSGNLIIVGTRNGRIFQSTDGGATFPNVFPSTGIWDVVADPNNSTRFFAAGQGGFFISNNSGASWTATPLTGPVLQALQSSNHARMSVANDGRIYIAIADVGQVAAVAFTTDQGSTFTQMDVPRFPTGSSAMPGTPGAISGATNTSPIVITTVANHGLNLSNNVVRVRIAGLTANTAANGDWIAAPVPPPPGMPNVPSPPNQFILLNPITGANSTGNAADTAGGTWQQWISISPGGQAGTHLSIKVDPAQSNLVYVGGDGAPGFIDDGCCAGLVRGDANVAPTGAIPSPQWANLSGKTIAQLPGGGTANGTGPHADTRSMTLDAAGTLVLGCDGGIFRRTNPRDATGDWKAANGTLGNVEFHDIAFDPHAGVLFGGTQDNGTPMQIFSGSFFWKEFEGSDGGDVHVDAVTLAPNSIRYTGSVGFGDFRRAVFDPDNVQQGPFENPKLIVTGTMGPLNIYGVDKNLGFVTPFALHHVTPSRMVIGGSQTVFESLDQGATLAQLGVGGGANDFDYGHVSDDNALWVAAATGVFVRLGMGGALTATPTAFPGMGGAVDVVMSAIDAKRAYVLGQNQVFMTPDGGTTWFDITGDLGSQTPGRLLSLIFVPGSSSDRLVLGSSNGVYAGTVGTATTPSVWRRLGTNLPRTLAFDLTYDNTEGRDMIVVGTLGRGAWTFGGLSQSNLPPVTKCKAVSVFANGMCQGVVPAPGIDNGSFDPEGGVLNCSQVPASPYPIGNTTVTLSCQDPQGASNSCQAAISVIDNVKPVFTRVPASQTISVCVNPNLGTVAATDNCGTPMIKSDAPAKFPLGKTVVTWTATDAAGNNTTVSRTITAILGDSRSCCPAGTRIIVGTNGSDQIVGTNGSDCILGLGGDDIIDGRGGNDFISGGSGNDIINAGLGNDMVWGGPGNDTINAATGVNLINGGPGTDVCDGVPGVDTIEECP